MLAHKRVTKVCPKWCPKSMCQGLKETVEYCRGPNGRGEVQVVDISLVLSEIGERGAAADNNDEIPEFSGGGHWWYGGGQSSSYLLHSSLAEPSTEMPSGAHSGWSACWPASHAT